MRFRTLSALLLICASSLTWAQEIPEGCDNIVAKIRANDIPGALEEAQWCEQALQQLAQAQVGALFPAEIPPWKRGEVTQNNALGIAVTEVVYTNGDQSVNVSLVEGTGGANSLGGIFALAAGIGAAAGQNLRINGNAAVLTNEGGNATLNITLDSGRSLNITSSDVPAAALREFAQQLPLDEL
ncbi:MAG TPA: hypothetical protein VJA26_03145 [Gammaproteobacteria bacterium]|nr:hypothetical protein [Gammaproteobacteria bacterium]